MKFFDNDPDDQLKLALAAAIAGVVITTLWGLFGLHQGSVLRIPQTLRGDVVHALERADLASLEVDMHGQRALLTGFVANRGQIDEARRTALTAAGPGGPWAGGVTAVDVLGVHVGTVERPFAWRAWRDGSSLVLSGAVPSERARRTLLTEAGALFPNAVSLDQMHAAGGAPSSNWTAVALDALKQLSMLNSGEARISDNEIVITGGGTQAAVDVLRAHYQQPPAPFRARLETSVQ
ncbi:MAG TPA: hypothetical protein VG943_07880 [Caulobacterales bacterium]|nr:hypothetical protein [Caulobacterales bacterium]